MASESVGWSWWPHLTVSSSSEGLKNFIRIYLEPIEPIVLPNSSELSCLHPPVTFVMAVLKGEHTRALFCYVAGNESVRMRGAMSLKMRSIPEEGPLTSGLCYSTQRMTLGRIERDHM